MNSIGDTIMDCILLVVLDLLIFIETKNIHNKSCFPLDGDHHPKVSVFNKYLLTSALLIKSIKFCSTLAFFKIVIA